MEADTEIEIQEIEISKNSNFVLPEVLEKIFKASEETKVDTTEKRLFLFKKLSCLLGEELMERTLDLLDRWNIVYYCIGSRIRVCYVAEWSSRRNNLPTTYRIVPGTNYCKCQFFQHRVLQIDEAKESVDAKPSRSGALFGGPMTYTCEHVLAQRIHKVLMKPQEHLVTFKQYLYLLKTMYED